MTLGQGAIAAVLLLGGGLDALQAMSIATGLPFTLILLFMCWSMYTAFDEELDLLEEYYDAALFKMRHPSLHPDGEDDTAEASSATTSES